MKKKEHVIPSAPVPVPYGAHVVDQGVHFSLFSRHATRVWLLLFDHAEDEAPKEEFELKPDRNRLGDLWHLHVPSARAGQYYVYRMDGPPRRRRRARLRPGPMAARSLCARRDRPEEVGRPRGHRPRPADPERPLFPKGIILKDDFDWEGDRTLRVPLNQTDHLRGQRARLHGASECRRHSIPAPTGG